MSIIYNSSDIGVWPGGPSTTAIEAAATGLAVIVPQSDSAYRLPIERNDEVGFARGEANSLIEKMGMLIENEKLKRLMGNLAKDLVLKELSWNR